ncbi:hypothetical protein N7513_008798 [Penicillium frequentans]|uniref:Uncharacterized protein n=1 Tax=Penicillium frequentans TaxID=3151616 RepID=A0AAD6CID4_9EURO|nr:hypothetical protein N7494_010338 [Penicillium glabrum]KAJ5535612.1 hypothetical protein N7513_008798 [Penicillium glabrum]
MSTLNNVASVANEKQGSFKPSIAPDGPLTDKGHKPGVKVNEADHRPEHHLQTFPPGTAPASNSYTSNVNDVGSQTNNPNMPSNQRTSAADTLMGATSQDVHTGLGKPLQGQTGVELAHDGEHGRKKQSAGLEGVGATPQNRGIERQFPNQRGIEREEAQNGTRGNKADRAAEDMLPEGAETLDAEWKYEPSTKRNK